MYFFPKWHQSLLLGLVAALLCGPAPAAEPDGDDKLQRLAYNNPGLVVDLGVGLWAWPLPMDYDGDGDLDLVVSCSDTPSNGIYFFENPGKSGEDGLPVFKPGVRIGNGQKNIAISYPDGKPRVLIPGEELTDAVGGKFAKRKKLVRSSNIYESGVKPRANQWSYIDYDGDDLLDLVVGIGDWSEYGWDNAFDETGTWTNGPLHGYVYLLKNTGSTESPSYQQAEKILAAGRPVDVFGMPSPNFADFDSDGDLDLLCGDFLDGFTYFENTGSRTQPSYAAGRELTRGGQPVNMHLCMIVPVAVDWNNDGHVDLVVGQEDGRVAYLQHTGRVENGMPQFTEPVFFRQQAENVKFGALSTPVGFDWDGDGDDDIVSGNTAGEIGFIENLDGGNPPKWAAPKLLQADGETIRIMAGPNGSIQGPAEAKWGYTTISIADWDNDNLPDVIANSIWGKVLWYRNVGSRTSPKLAAAQPITVNWPGDPPRPEWNWWKPEGKSLVTQWRTTPNAVDWNGDGLVDLVMLDHEGYLVLFPRARKGKELVLQPGRRIFQGPGSDKDGKAIGGDSDALRLNPGIAGKSGRRKSTVTDWNNDGRPDLLLNSMNVSVLQNMGGDHGNVALKDIGPVDTRRLAGHDTSPTTVDWNQDGLPDLLVGGEDGFFYYMQNPLTEAAQKAAPAKPAKTSGKTSGTTSSKPSQQVSADSPLRKNVLFIAVDDMRNDLGCYGQSQILSPNIDRLASQGTLFTRAYCQQAVCNPSRASLLTGLRPDTLQIWDLPTHFRERRPNVVTLPQLFKQHGYHTQNIGKIFHNWVQEDYQGDPASWSVPAVMHYNNHGADKPVVSGKLPPDLSGVPRTEMRDVDDAAYFDGRIAERAVQALRDLQALRDQQDREFFLAVGFWKPHAPFNAPKKYWDLYDRSKITLAEHRDPPKNAPEIALHDSREILRGFKDRPDGRPTEEEAKALRHGYYAAISYVDAQIGKVLAELDRLGLADSTIVVFWSDHGYHLGEQSLWAKTSNYELDARVPLIIRTPEQAAGRQPAGQKTEALVELLDLYPTLADYCALPAPADLEGESLVPVLNDPSKSVREASLTQHPRPAYYPEFGENPEAMGYSLRTDSHRYVEWRDFKTGKVVARELYDHQNDSDETVNLAGQPASKSTVDKLATLLKATLNESR